MLPQQWDKYLLGYAISSLSVTSFQINRYKNLAKLYKTIYVHCTAIENFCVFFVITASKLKFQKLFQKTNI